MDLAARPSKTGKAIILGKRRPGVLFVDAEIVHISNLDRQFDSEVGIDPIADGPLPNERNGPPRDFVRKRGEFVCVVEVNEGTFGLQMNTVQPPEIFRFHAIKFLIGGVNVEEAETRKSGSVPSICDCGAELFHHSTLFRRSTTNEKAPRFPGAPHNRRMGALHPCTA